MPCWPTIAAGDGLIDSGWPLVIRNSVFYENDVSDRLFLTANNDTTVSHSILPEKDAFQDGGGNIYGAAAFVNPLSFDFRPAPGAPQIDAGDANTAQLYDLDFAPVLDDSGTPNSGLGTPTFVDIGPYEYQESTLLRVTEPSASGGLDHGLGGNCRLDQRGYRHCGHRRVSRWWSELYVGCHQPRCWHRRS